MKIYNNFDSLFKAQSDIKSNVTVYNKSHLFTAPAGVVFSGVEFEKTDDGYLIVTVLKRFVTDKSFDVIESVILPVCSNFGVEVKQKNEDDCYDFYGDRALTQEEAEQLQWKLELILQN